MGLLNLNNLGGNTALQAGLGILANNTGHYGAFAPAFGRGAMQGMQQAQGFRQDQAYEEYRKQQMEMQKAAKARQMQQDAARQQASQDVSSQFGIDPNLLMAYPDIGKSLLERQLIPKDKKIDFAPNGMAFDANNPDLKVGESYAAPEKVSMPSAVQEYNFAKDQGYGGSFLDFQLAQKKAGAAKTAVSVNTGQKGFDNTLKLRGDFRSEPIYKAHQDVKSAHGQISAALKKASPAGDLAGATKLMKILDPGSVVRESELAMAMAASGKLDRLENYASMVVSGNKLTPKQRIDFQELADDLNEESARLYNAKRDEYKGIADRNDLNELDVLGSPDTVQTPNGQANPLPSKPSALTLKKGTVYQTPKGQLRWNGKSFEDL